MAEHERVTYASLPGKVCTKRAIRFRFLTRSPGQTVGVDARTFS